MQPNYHPGSVILIVPNLNIGSINVSKTSSYASKFHTQNPYLTIHISQGCRHSTSSYRQIFLPRPATDPSKARSYATSCLAQLLTTNQATCQLRARVVMCSKLLRVLTFAFYEFLPGSATNPSEARSYASSSLAQLLTTNRATGQE